MVILKFIRNVSSDSLEIKQTVLGTSPTSCFNPVIVSLTSLVDPFHSCFVITCKKSTMKNDKMLTQSKFKIDQLYPSGYALYFEYILFWIWEFDTLNHSSGLILFFMGGG